jgi:hypothetical protein
MNDTSKYLWGILFGGIAISYIIYGRRTKTTLSLLAGVVLFVLPYLVSTEYLLMEIGAVVMLVPYFFSL